MRECFIIDGVRTPRATGKKGTLYAIHPQRMVSGLLNALKERVGFDVTDVEDVVMGCALPEAEHGADIARLSLLDAGWDVRIPGITMQRFCGSGPSALSYAAFGIKCGQFDCLVAGGVEVQSHYTVPGGGLPPGGRPFTMDGNNPHLQKLYPMVPQSIAADLIATLEGFSREDCDRLALRSQNNAEVAIKEGRFAKTMIPVKDYDGNVVLDHEEHPRFGTTLEALGKIKAAFTDISETVWEDLGKSFLQMCQQVYPQVKKLNNVHTGGNSSGVVDGASALLLCSPEYAKAHGLKPRGRIVSGASVGVEPVVMLTGPGPAALKVLKHMGMKVSDIDLWEINEAFASVVLKTIRDLKLDPAIVNVNGGAIALGHPIGATGGILTMTALDELERRNKKTAMISMCTGGAMGSAMIIERV